MFKESRKLYEDRCDFFIRRILNDRFFETVDLKATFAKTKEHVRFENHLSLDYKPISIGDDWGEAWESAWFHISGEIPESWGDSEVAIELNLSGEAQVFDEHGVPYYALTGNSVFNTSYYKDLFFIPNFMIKNRKFELWIEAAANSLFGICLDNDPHSLEIDLKGKFPARVLSMKLGKFNREAWSLRFDFEILHDLYGQLPEGNYRKRQLISAMNKAINAYADCSTNSAKAREILKPELERMANDSALSVSAIGHAHIDVGWLWTVQESIRKVGRTFSSQIWAIENYPNYSFGASQAQLYAFARDHYPELYEKIKKAVADGRWELQGGMWVEADCNITGGESMVRQFIHGKNFFMDEFGVDVRNLWLPDVFGYSAALPQIIRKSGCEYFLTQKISWNQFDEFPHNTFIWSGIDGSSVLTHFPPENTYNASVTPKELVPAQNRFAESDILPEFASLFGLGDGGGGPSEQHLERAKRLHNLEGVPKFKFDHTANFFERIKPYADKLPKWAGELYLELHRGTLTTQARTKRNNRKLEQYLATVEFLYSMLPLANYPIAEIDGIWKKLLINQFHDIIPGSSIGEVYEVTEAEHSEALAKCAELEAEALLQLTTPDNSAITLVNTLSTPWQGTIELPEEWLGFKIVDINSLELKTQYDGEKLLALVQVPASDSATIFRDSRQNVREVSSSSNLVLENDLVRYEFDKAGHLIYGYDKEVSRKLFCCKEYGNVLRVIVDRPNNYDAWDVDIFYREEETIELPCVAVGEVVSGAVESSLKLTFSNGTSTVTQKVRLSSSSKRLDFESHADWHESRKMLRVSFPATVMTSEASYEIQYGFVRRPLHENTSWDMAKFEVPAQRYMDLSERYYGVALLNDCKYGCRASKNMLDLCLLRSPLYPDPNADRGEHYFTYSYLPHQEDLIDSCVMAEAAMLNRMPSVIYGAKASCATPFKVESKGVSLEVVKRAEKSERLVIRLAECSGERSTAVIKTTLAKDLKMNETNLLEWTNDASFVFENGSLAIELKPFEIKTLIVAE